jgi:hypothetical protein
MKPFTISAEEQICELAVDTACHRSPGYLQKSGSRSCRCRSRRPGRCRGGAAAAARVRAPSRRLDDRLVRGRYLIRRCSALPTRWQPSPSQDAGSQLIGVAQ